MAPQKSDTLPDVAPEILSDEEMRSRAAASAQQLYESRLEAYRLQREQLLEVQRVRAEYERCRAAYEEACRVYRESKNLAATASAVVRVDPDTGAQTAVPTEPAPVAVPANFENENVPEENFPDVPEFADEALSAPAEAPASVPENEEKVADVPARDEETVPARAEKKVSPKRAERRPAHPSRFPIISVLVVIFFAAEFSALGYIAFSGDPRFEELRERFRTLISSTPATTTEEADVPAATE